MTVTTINHPLGPNGPAYGLVLRTCQFIKNDGTIVSAVAIAYLDPKTESGMGFVLTVAKSPVIGETTYSKFVVPTVACMWEIIELLARAQPSKEAP